MLARCLLAAALTAVLAACAAAPASAKSSVPRNFYGTTFDGNATVETAENQDRQFAVMALSGVETARITFPWTALEPRKKKFDFDRTDRQVEAAARHGINVLPVILYTPYWARVNKKKHYSPPKNVNDFNLLMKKLVLRYGPKGSFWKKNPDVPKQSIRAWQIWNEPNNDIERYWDAKKYTKYGWPGGYANLLRGANKTIKRYDPKAKTVLGGLTGLAWLELRRLYKFNVRNAFDVAALQVYPESVTNEMKSLTALRDSLKRNKDTDVRLWVTEVAFPAAKGKTKPINGQKQQTTRGMAARLTELYSRLAKKRRAWGLERVYWYTWASRYGKNKSAFDFSGLVESKDGSEIKATPSLKAYQRSAQRAQGCVKDVLARCQ